MVVASPSTAYLTFDQEGAEHHLRRRPSALTRQVDAGTASFVDTNGDLAAGHPASRATSTAASSATTPTSTSPSAPTRRAPTSSACWRPPSTTPTTPAPTSCPTTPSRARHSGPSTITPVFSTALFGGYTYYTADDDIDSELNIAEGEAGLVYQPDENLRIRGGIGYADRHREGDDLTTGERHTIQDDRA